MHIVLRYYDMSEIHRSLYESAYTRNLEGFRAFLILSYQFFHFYAILTAAKNGKSVQRMKSLSISRKEAEKVTHDINNVWHKKFQGEEVCMIETHSHKPDSPSYCYYFINHGFDDYEFFAKLPTIDRR